MRTRMNEQMTADELRDVERGTYLVVDLHSDAYWEMGCGRVTGVAEYDSGATHVIIDHNSRLKIPADAREGLRFSGAARGSNNLKVKSVYEK